MKTYLLQKSKHVLELMTAAEINQGVLSGTIDKELQVYDDSIEQWLRVKDLAQQKDLVVRRFPRIFYQAQFVLHDQNTLWKAQSLVLSAGGIGLAVNTKALEIGQEIFLHKVSRGADLEINAVCAVRFQFTNERMAHGSLYGLEFIDISKDSQLQIADFTLNATLNNAKGND